MDHDLSKLPKWAQRRISVLEANVEAAKRRIADLNGSVEGSIAFEAPYAVTPRPLGADPHVRFYPHPDQPNAYIDLRVDKPRPGQHMLRVMSDGWLKVIPQSSNVILLDTRDPRK